MEERKQRCPQLLPAGRLHPRERLLNRSEVPFVHQQWGAGERIANGGELALDHLQIIQTIRNVIGRSRQILDIPRGCSQYLGIVVSSPVNPQQLLRHPLNFL
ncbi:hypothetical protein D3C75_686870 [compost metagenome]